MAYRRMALIAPPQCARAEDNRDEMLRWAHQDSNPGRRVRSPTGYPSYPIRPNAPPTRRYSRRRAIAGPCSERVPAWPTAAASAVATRGCLSLWPMPSASQHPAVWGSRNSPCPSRESMAICSWRTTLRRAPACSWRPSLQTPPHPGDAASMRTGRRAAGTTPSSSMRKSASSAMTSARMWPSSPRRRGSRSEPCARSTGGSSEKDELGARRAALRMPERAPAVEPATRARERRAC